MLLHVSITDKSFGGKQLYHDLDFDIQEGEKIGLIGRNGTGKSTLLQLISGVDTDYQGQIQLKKGTVLIASRQEHAGFENLSALAYIQGDLPEYEQLSKIIQNCPMEMADNPRKMQIYSDALDRFSQLGYFQIEDEIARAFDDYQLGSDRIHNLLGSFSGGQKRLIELIKVQRARGDFAVIDEPTNHMDYVAKLSFITWLRTTTEAVLVVTHDRDVLMEVDRIIEIRDGSAKTFRGNYQQYLRINTHKMSAEVTEFDQIQRRITNLRQDLIRFRRLKEKARDPGTIKRFKSQENKVEAELNSLLKQEQPSFWIDRESATDLNQKLTTSYQKYKAKNIQLSTSDSSPVSNRLLVQATNLSLAYTNVTLFGPLSFALHEGERIRIHGRNGAGKTTIMNEILTKARLAQTTAQIISGTLAVERDITIGVYDQEIDHRYLPMTLAAAIESALDEKGLPMSEQTVKQLMGDYLFHPGQDGNTPISQLSGGQKARFQLIRMLLASPQLLILDEPTNHLDLPSIEELEDAIGRYNGAVIYISHDSLFAKKVGGQTVLLQPGKN